MFKIIRKDVLEMNNLQKIMLLKDRLNRLERNDKDNFNICRRIRREIEQLRRQEQA